MSYVPTVLFLCTGNSARSQMAEALLRQHAGERFNVISAGTNPKPLHPLAVRVMNEIGIDISHQQPKDLSTFLGKTPVRHLIVVCGSAQKTCPAMWPGVLTRELWDLNDPAAADGSEEGRLEAFRRSRDDIGARINDWLIRQ